LKKTSTGIIGFQLKGCMDARSEQSLFQEECVKVSLTFTVVLSSQVVLNHKGYVLVGDKLWEKMMNSLDFFTKCHLHSCPTGGRVKTLIQCGKP
jgi:hypothetical protein